MTTDQSSQPRVELADVILEANARAWRVHSGLPLWAVVKSNGYGWGLERVAHAVMHTVDGFCVADEHEFRRLRVITDKPVILFAQPSLATLTACIDQGAIPNITSPAALELVAKHGQLRGEPCRVRLGLAPAVGWFGIATADLPRMISVAQSPWLQVEAWTHFTRHEQLQNETTTFHSFLSALRNAGISLAGIDAESSAPLAERAAEFQRARIGIGLFGAHARQVAGVACPFTVIAPTMSVIQADATTRVGYAARAAGAGSTLRTLRVGYGDGFPRGMVGAQTTYGEIFSVGMQYTVLRSQARVDTDWAGTTLLNHNTDLSHMIASSTTSVHEMTLALGNASRRSNTTL